MTTFLAYSYLFEDQAGLETRDATFVYLFDPTRLEPDEPNPDLGITPQAPYAQALLNWLTAHLQKDADYEKHLRSHYQQVKEAAANPTHPAHAKYLAWKASLPAEDDILNDEAPHSTPRRKSAVKKQATTVPKAMQARYEEIVAITDHFSRQHLSDEYQELCRQVAAALARKRPSPLSGGKANVWAASIVYALGQINFLFDKSQEPYVSADELCASFGVSKSTAGNKARQIRDILDIGVFDPKWSLPSRLSENPMAWMITVNGFMMDARRSPREIQEEAYRKGLIPYVPGGEA